MSTPVIAFFNNKGGVGKTSLVYHIAWMLAEQEYRVLAADLDPQGNLSAAFVDEQRLEQLWPENQRPSTIFGALRPLLDGVGDIDSPYLELLSDGLALIPGDMALSKFEDELSEVWPNCLDGKVRAFRVMSAFWRIMQKGADKHNADVILIDLGPNLGAVNRAALIASDYVVIPLEPDLFSLQGLRNLGPTLQAWRKGWGERLPKNTAAELPLPKGSMQPLGYIVMQHSVRRDRPVISYDKWIARIPSTYRQYVLGQNSNEGSVPLVAQDEHCLALMKHYRSLMPMAQEVRKPIFRLRSADGAIGAHTYAVQDAYNDFKKLALSIMTHATVVPQGIVSSMER